MPRKSADQLAAAALNDRLLFNRHRIASDDDPPIERVEGFTLRALEAFSHLRKSKEPTLGGCFFWYDVLVGELLADNAIYPWEITAALLRPDVTPQNHWEGRARQRWLDLEHALVIARGD
jgi:hypothetical protein